MRACYLKGTNCARLAATTQRSAYVSARSSRFPAMERAVPEECYLGC